MEKNTIRAVVFIFTAFVIGCAVASVVAIIFGGSNNRADGRTGSELSTAAEYNRTITEEQRRTLDGITDSQGGVGRSIEALERIRGITEETDSALTELRELNRGSNNISAAIRAEAYLLADYYRCIGNIVNDYFNNMGSE